jgi:hypothetical protein
MRRVLRRRCRRCRRCRAGRSAHCASELALELPVAVLQLLDDAGHLPDLRLEPVDAGNQFAGRRLCDTAVLHRSRLLLRRGLRIALLR